ncbi:hypothetical protein Clacol_006712 [Clathrus columnatus]|uniref:Cell cycle control protein n=1 Tax=Clathrus columnatus TaxID=1419009 RepID=A0AAV5AHW0_9AGAM|nr:hypothetical protein Clacol_006712 [Clathrus columnatus]
MSLFRRRNESGQDSTDNEHNTENKKTKGSWKKPANTAFKQQRLKAWQPILTPKTVISTLLIIGLLFAPIGGLLIWGNSKVSQITFEYSGCEKQGSTFSNLPNFNYQLRSSDSKLSIDPPQWAFNEPNCTIQFDLPADLSPSVFLYYKLTNFFQNHRRYVQSLNTDQLKGQIVSLSTLDSSTCKPLSTVGAKAIYPCGLIANSLFNDTISNPTLLNPSGGSQAIEYVFSDKGIAWPGEAKKYGATQYNLSTIVPPPNWAKRFPNNYSSENPPPDFTTDERFQNWMRTAGLPTFSKLYGRNDTATMFKGKYNISIEMNYPVESFGGTKSIVISTIAWTGGKNAFLGWAYVAASGLLVLLAILGTIRHVVKPRRIGDMSLLSWNQVSAK